MATAAAKQVVLNPNPGGLPAEASHISFPRLVDFMRKAKNWYTKQQQLPMRWCNVRNPEILLQRLAILGFVLTTR